MKKLDINILEKLGKLTHKLRVEVAKISQEGVDITEIIDFVENTIFDAGYLPAFPCTVAINEVAAHYTVFDEGYVLKKGDLIKIDFGISDNGFITDNAITIEIGTNEYKDLIDANLEALNKAIDKVDIGVTMSDIGKIVNTVAQDKGFNTIHNLSGHQITINDLHCGLHVPNYENKDLSKIEDNMELAIEPFFTQGEPMIKACGLSNILHLNKDTQIRDAIARKVLNHIKEKYPKLPFSKRWLLKTFDKRKVMYAIKLLKAKDIIIEYETLVSVDGSYISQFEDTVVFADNKKSVITRL